MKTLKKSFSIILCLSLVFGIVAVFGLGINKETGLKVSAVSHSVGDLVEFGTYPQREVKDSETLALLNSQTLSWVSYGYYSGTGTWDDGQMTAKDYMKYADVTVNGTKYRAVKFTEYRPCCTGFTSSNSQQDDNGYEINNTYWFQFEPIKWRVLDPATGFILCESIIDSQAFNNYCIFDGNYWGKSGETYYCANNYAKSSIRDWLNDDFYHTAFSSEDEGNIKTPHLENKAYLQEYSQYDCADTDDKVFLLSYSDVLNPNYGFSSNDCDYDKARRAQGTNYAKCQGLWVNSSSGSEYEGNSNWRLRSPGYGAYYSCIVFNFGNANDRSYCGTGRTGVGVRAALNISNLDELPTVGQGEIETYVLTYNANGGTGEPQAQTGAISYVVSSTEPTRSGYIFLGWSLSSTATTATYTAGNNIALTEDTTLYAVWFKEIGIKNYVANRTVDYKTTITFTAEISNMPEGTSIHWFINGEDKGTGDKFTIDKATSDFTVQIKLVDSDGTVLKESEIETVKVKTGLFDKIIAFFRGLFKKLPNITQ